MHVWLDDSHERVRESRDIYEDGIIREGDRCSRLEVNDDEEQDGQTEVVTVVYVPSVSFEQRTYPG